jgi:predicted nuclease of restriction endonuclease-like (RecB) superfamily
MIESDERAENDLMAKKKSPTPAAMLPAADYSGLLGDVVLLLESARHTAARAVNSVMTATYWEIGRRIVEVEQRGLAQAEYGDELIKRLAADLTSRFGRGFGWRNVYQMRAFHLAYPNILQTLSAKSVHPKLDTVSGKLPPLSAKLQMPSEVAIESLGQISAFFPLPWSHYVKLLSVDDANARKFYETEALRGGWSVRQLDRQISTLFYQRTLLSKNKATMLRKGAEPQPSDLVTPDEEIKDPLVLEFLNLKDEYSEHELEDALIHKLEDFLLELGGNFTFVGRQRRLRIGDEWYRIDLLFFHRKLRCLVVIDLKIGKFTHADAGQMHLYLNYAREHWTNEGENPPVGLILCAEKDEAVAHYALEGLPNKVMAAEYRMALPDENVLTAELKKTQRALELRQTSGEPSSPPPKAKRSKKKSDTE